MKKNKKDINGVLLLNKPYGVSSNRALQKAKGIFSAKKAGHTGSLDPLATGLLPICFGEATKFSQYLLDSDKIYEVEFELGKKTSTGDAEGEVIAENAVPDLSEVDLTLILKRFEGEIEQVPPMYSAIKQNGEPLYKLARKGVEVERKARCVTIHHIKLLHFSEKHVSCEVNCSKGTYIRTLVEDIGEALGCGAYVTALHRTGVAHYKNQMTSLEKLNEMNGRGQDIFDNILPVESMLQGWPQLTLSDEVTHLLKQGQEVTIDTNDVGVFAVYTTSGEFVGIGEIKAAGRLNPKRLMKTG